MNEINIIIGKQQGSICHDEKVAYRPFIAIYTVGWIKWLYGGKRPLSSWLAVPLWAIAEYLIPTLLWQIWLYIHITILRRFIHIHLLYACIRCLSKPIQKNPKNRIPFHLSYIFRAFTRIPSAILSWSTNHLMSFDTFFMIFFLKSCWLLVTYW